MLIDLELESMIQSELVNRGIHSQEVIQAFRQIPRKLFVPDYLQHQAYEDERLPIGLGQTLSPPYVVARMLQELQLSGKKSVLDVGTGTGYQAALLSTIVPEVYTIELKPELSARARKVLVDDLGIHNVRFHVGDGQLGWSERAPFDGIVVNAAAGEVLWSLAGQLRSGGRLVLPVGEGTQSLNVVTKKGLEDEVEVIPEDEFVSRFRAMAGDLVDD